MRQVLVLLLTIFVSICSASAGTMHPDVPDNKYVEYGKKFRCISRLIGRYKNNHQYAASAIIIRPKVILTAAHVIADSQECFAVLDGKKIPLRKIIMPSNFQENIFGYNDLAIGFTDQDFELDFYPELYSDRDEVGQISAICGFGIFGTFDTGSSKYDGQRRAGSNKIEHIDRGLLICTPSARDRTSLEFLISSGDSGGGLFINKKLAGINSCVMATDNVTDSSYTDESGHTRVSDHFDWIQQIIEIEANGLDTDLPSATIVLNSATK
jgi:hypothetical protein